VYFIDGYFVFNTPGTQQYQITNLYSTAIEPLAFASAEGAPDLLITLIVDHKEIWLLGETTTEVHFNSGNVDFPFEPIQGAFIQQGCAAKFSAAKLNTQNGGGTIIWLTRRRERQRSGRQVRRLPGAAHLRPCARVRHSRLLAHR
jgi:hypothetical protein